MNVSRPPQPPTPTPPAPEPAQAPERQALPDPDALPLAVAHTLVIAPPVSDMSRSDVSAPGSTLQLLVQQGQRVRMHCTPHHLLMVPIIAGNAGSTAGGAYCLSTLLPLALNSTANLVTAIGYGAMTTSCAAIALTTTGELIATTVRQRQPQRAEAAPATTMTPPPENVIVVQQPDGAVLLGAEQRDTTT